MALLVRLATRLPRLLAATPDATLPSLGGPQLGRARWRHRALSTEAATTDGGEPAPIAAIEPMMRASFVCQACSTRGLWTFKRRTYEKGVVLVRCKSCDKMHLVADNLGWFRDEKTNLETLAGEKGEKVLRAHDVQFMFDDSARLQESDDNQ